MIEDIDRTIRDEIRKGEYPGALFIMVRGNEVVFQKGWGYADLSQKKPMDPERTVCQIGSVSKLFAATAAMQQIERGTLDLDKNINERLSGLRIANPFPQPITLRRLLTHSSGLDENLVGKRALDPTQLESLGLHLRRIGLAVVDPPGSVIRYSNYGFSVIGLLVEECGHRPFSEYLDANVFRPLGMKSSSFVQPSPLSAELAVGYTCVRRRLTPRQPVLVNDVPAGAMTTRVGDIANFMIAFLNDGRFGTTTILKPESVRQMFSRQHTGDPRLPFGYGLGWQLEDRAGRRVVRHDGGAGGHLCRLLLVPELGMGFFIYYNSWDSPSVYRLTDKLLYDYFAPADFRLEQVKVSGSPDCRLSGVYRGSIYSHHTIFKLLLLAGMSSERRVEVAPDGRIKARGKIYLPIARLLYREKAGEGTIAFRIDDSGRVKMYDNPAMEWEKLRWYEGQIFNGAWLMSCLGLFISGPLIGAATAAFARVRRWRLVAMRTSRSDENPQAETTRIPASSSKGPALARFSVSVAAGLLLVPAFVLVIQGSSAEIVPFRISTTWKVILLVLPQSFLLLSCIVGAAAVVSWRSSWWNLAARIHFSLTAAAGLGLVWFLWYWNVIGYRI